jgi:hypothetical protein
MVVVLVGVIAALIAVLANPLGIADPGFGWKQGVLLAIGILLIIAGGVMALRSPHGGTGAHPHNRRRYAAGYCVGDVARKPGARRPLVRALGGRQVRAVDRHAENQ